MKKLNKNIWQKKKKKSSASVSSILLKKNSPIAFIVQPYSVKAQLYVII